MSLNYVTVTFTGQDAGQDAATGGVSIVPTSAVTAGGVTVVSQQPVVRQFSAGSVSVQLVASDNAGTTPASGFWAYQITLPNVTPGLYLVNFANGSSQRFDQLTPVVASTTYGPAGTGALAGAGGVPAGALAPKVVALTDGATIAVQASAGNDFYVTLGGNRTMLAPSNPADGQKITFEITQDGTGSRTLTWTGGAGGYAFGSGSAPALSTSPGASDQVGFRYSARKGAWLVLGADGGF